MKEVIRQIRLEVVVKIYICADKEEDTCAGFLVQLYLDERKESLCNKCWNQLSGQYSLTVGCDEFLIPSYLKADEKRFSSKVF